MSKSAVSETNNRDKQTDKGFKMCFYVSNTVGIYFDKLIIYHLVKRCYLTLQFDFFLYLCRYSYENPVRALSNEDLPAPEGPMMAVSCPDLNTPDTPWRMVFFSGTMEKYTVNIL